MLPYEIVQVLDIQEIFRPPSDRTTGIVPAISIPSCSIRIDQGILPPFREKSRFLKGLNDPLRLFNRLILFPF